MFRIPGDAGSWRLRLPLVSVARLRSQHLGETANEVVHTLL